jgi:hypothetical protein
MFHSISLLWTQLDLVQDENWHFEQHLPGSCMQYHTGMFVIVEWQTVSGRAATSSLGVKVLSFSLFHSQPISQKSVLWLCCMLLFFPSVRLPRGFPHHNFASIYRFSFRASCPFHQKGVPKIPQQSIFFFMKTFSVVFYRCMIALTLLLKKNCVRVKQIGW